MKNYRVMVAVLLVFMMALSVYSLVNSAAEKESKLNALQQQADELTEKGLVDRAASKYAEMIQINDSVDYYVAICNLYTDESHEIDRLAMARQTAARFPKDPKAYVPALRAYIDMNRLNEAFELLDKYTGEKLQSEEVDKIREEIEYAFYTEYVDAKDVQQPCGNYAGACAEDGRWGFLTTGGAYLVPAEYARVGQFARDTAPVLTEDGQWYQMDTEGIMIQNISSAVEGTVEDTGILNEGLMPICVGGKYSYYTEQFHKTQGEYDFAGGFNLGIAAVRTGESWSIVNTEGKAVAEGFQDIKLDQRSVCCMQDRMAVKKDGKYFLADLSGKKVGSGEFDDMKSVSNGPLVAIKSGDKWGFADLSGKIVIEPAYEDACSFSNGVAAVKTGGQWGYIDVNNKMVIPAQYTDCRNMSANGCAFVKDGNNWFTLKLYSKNF